jgi:UTP-glucose-1-phosphate uridylyltransferase
MLPVVDKPLIQYAVEEAIAAGITELIFITGRNKRSIEDHFDKAYELETELENKNKQKLLDTVRGIIPPSVSCIYIRQSEALGLGHAVLCARPVVGDEPFAVILADDLIDGEPGAMEQMVSLFDTTHSSVLGWKPWHAKKPALTALWKSAASRMASSVWSALWKSRIRMWLRPIWPWWGVTSSPRAFSTNC